MTRRFAVGIDLGQQRDPSTVVIAEVGTQVIRNGKPQPSIVEVTHLERIALGTSYATIRQHIGSLARKLHFVEPTILIDANGPGAPMVDELRAVDVPRLVAVRATGGDAETRTKQRGFQEDWNVSKSTLIRSVSALVFSQRLKIAKGLSLADDLLTELSDLESRVSASGRESFDVATGSDHHADLVSGLALCTWWLSKPPPRRVVGYNLGRPYH